METRTIAIIAAAAIAAPFALASVAHATSCPGTREYCDMLWGQERHELEIRDLRLQQQLQEDKQWWEHERQWWEQHRRQQE